MERNFGNHKNITPEEIFDSNIMAQLFFINLIEGDSFLMNNKVISVDKIVPQKSIRLIVDGKRKTIWWIGGGFIGHKGTNYDWFDNVFRNVEGAIIVDLLNIKNPLHAESIFFTIAKRDKIYTE